MKARVHVYIGGTVQGVFFRYHTQEMAKRVGVSGWVRNLRDGRVEAVFEGERKDVDRMVEFCRKGPPSANVKHVEVKPEGYKGEFSGFEVRYD